MSRRVGRWVAGAAPVIPAVGVALVVASWTLVEEPAPSAVRSRTALAPSPAAPSPPGSGVPEPLAPSPRPRAAARDERLEQARPHLVALRRLCRTPAERAAVDALERALRPPAASTPSSRPEEAATSRPAARDARLEAGLSAMTSTDPRARAMATSRLALRAATPEGREALGRLLDDPDPAVRAGAARALAFAHEPGDLLLQRLEREEDASVRGALLAGLERTLGPAALDPLLTHGLRHGWTPDLAAAVRRLSARVGRPEPPDLPPAPARRR